MSDFVSLYTAFSGLQAAQARELNVMVHLGCMLGLGRYVKFYSIADETGRTHLAGEHHLPVPADLVVQRVVAGDLLRNPPAVRVEPCQAVEAGHGGIHRGNITAFPFPITELGP